MKKNDEKYQQWLDANPDKKGTEDYLIVKSLLKNLDKKGTEDYLIVEKAAKGITDGSGVSQEPTKEPNNDENEIKYTYIALWIGNVVLLYGLFGPGGKELFLGGVIFAIAMCCRLYYLNNLKMASKLNKNLHYLFLILCIVIVIVIN